MSNPTRPVRVYLAGKITNHENDWRRHIVSNVATKFNYTQAEVAPWETGNASQETHPSRWTWPMRPSLIPGVDITGPFFIEGEGHDGQHGPNLHGVGEYGNAWGEPECYCGHCCTGNRLSADRQERTVELCKRAIRSSDLVYVWGEGLDTAYGTLAEIGYAVGVGKKVVAASPDFWGSCSVADDQWFALTMMNVYVNAETPIAGLTRLIAPFLRQRLEALCESPPERALYRESLTRFPHTLTPQHTVGRYRLDFAIIDRKIAVEVDGLTYHNGQDSFIKDQQRQRDLQAQGWTVIRFAAKEVTDNPRRCLDEIARLAG